MSVLLFAVEFDPVKHFSGAGFVAVFVMAMAVILLGMFCPSEPSKSRVSPQKD